MFVELSMCFVRAGPFGFNRYSRVLLGEGKQDVESRSAPQPQPTDPVLWWRNSYQRDHDAFQLAHGRRPESLLELSEWLSPIPLRAPAKSS
jgi:hypothetical protein